MGDVSESLRDNTNYLWILFLSLFILLFSFCLFFLCQKVIDFCIRYCRIRHCGGCCWCCRIDLDEYRRERQHLQRLRQLGRAERNNSSTATREAEIALATFTQIPGPIPDAHGLRELHRQAAVRDLTSLGFIVFTTHPSGGTDDAATASAADVNSLQMRNHLTAQQRRDILDRLLSSRTYHAEQEHDSSVKDMEEGEPPQQQSEQGEEVENATTGPVTTSYAFPLREEPKEPDKTCAICLEDFVEGESINDTSKCPHVFHKACLIAWLDMHDVCPCCRCAMITDTEWRHAATQYRAEPRSTGTKSERNENDSQVRASSNSTTEQGQGETEITSSADQRHLQSDDEAPISS